MAKKPSRAAANPFDERINTALARGQYPTALDLAKKYVAQESTEASRAKLRRVYLDSVAWYVRKNSNAEALKLLYEAEKLSGDVGWWEQLAYGFVDVGEYPRAVQLAELTKQEQLKPKLLARLVDVAVGQGGGGKKLLPAELHAGFELVLKAFQLYETDKADEAREALQGIGLQSPFLEWKVLLRGLLAYAVKDDIKVMENWSRLDSNRLPAKLAEPLRMEIDLKFRDGLSAKHGQLLQKRRAIIQGENPAERLREMHRTLASGEHLGEVWRLARPAYVELQKNHPLLAAKVQNVLYWALISQGGPRDLDEFYKAVGAHPADPQTTRLRALVMESLDGEMQKAQKFWNEYQQWIEKNPERWPSGQADRARAVIWLRMGENAVEVLDEIAETGGKDQQMMGPFGRIFGMFQPPGNREPLKPGAEECFSRAAKLAPDWIEPAAHLFRLYFTGEQFAKAEELARDLVAKFPNDLQTLQAAEQINTQLGRTGEALDYARRAFQTNPLDRRLRDRVAVAAFGHARALLESNDFNGARTLLGEAATLSDQRQAGRVLCLSLILEEKAKNLAGAEAIREQVEKLPNERLAVIYRLAVEAGRVKLPPKRKKELEAPLKTVLEETPTIAELIPLLGAVADYDQETVKYRGFLTHAKKVRGMAEKAIQPGTTEEALKQLGFQLLRLKFWPSLLKLSQFGTRAFKTSPYFYYFEAEYGAKNPARPMRGYLDHGFREAYRIIHAAPAGTFKDLEQPLKRLQELEPWLANLTNRNFFEDYFGM